ncbi:MAG: type II toxin-antitoxin system RelE/ParE family toxin [Methylomonas sp.]|jgi:toxin ParE1/3/4
MAKLQLSKPAEKDLINIATYTIKKIGAKQAGLYKDSLFNTLEAIAKFPLMGSDRSHIKPELRRFVFGSDTIYYRVNDGNIFILRILGPGEDPLLKFKYYS